MHHRVQAPCRRYADVETSRAIDGGVTVRWRGSGREGVENVT
jgi:hypothetical protein